MFAIPVEQTFRKNAEGEFEKALETGGFIHTTFFEKVFEKG